MIFFNRCVQFLMVFWLVTTCCCVCQAQPFQFSFHHLSPNEGLSQGTNFFIHQDSKGFIWLSSLDGLNRFDGKTVKIYKATSTNGLLGNIVTSNFFEDDQSNLWFTTYEGIHCYVRKKDRFYHHQLKDSQGKKITQGYYAFHLDKQQKLWVRTGLGDWGYLHLFDTKTQHDSILCPIDGQRNHPVINKNGEVTKVVSTYFHIKTKMGLELIDLEQNFQKTTFFASPDEPLPIAACKSICIEHDSLWWVGTRNGLIAFNPHKKTADVYSTYQNKEIGVILDVKRIQDSLFIVSTSKTGVLIFSKQRRKFIQSIPKEPENRLGLNLQGIEAFYIDKQENLWVSSQRNGVAYTNLRKQKFEKKSPLEGIAMISIFLSKDQSIWCNGQTGAVLRFDPDGIKYQTIQMMRPAAIPVGTIEYFFEDQSGTLWGVWEKYLFKWSPDKQTFSFVQELPSNVLCAYTLADGTVLISTYGGIYRFQYKNKAAVFTKPASLGNKNQSSEATAFHEDRNQRLYIALEATKLVILEKKKELYQRRLVIENIGYARSFYEQDSILWVATTTGILKINTNDLTYEKLNEKIHKVPNETYYCVLPDASGNLWLSCNRGIIKYNPDKKNYRRYTLLDGLQDNEFNTNAYLLKPNGEMWMGGNNGLNVFQPDQMREVPYAPHVQFTHLLVNDEPFNTEVEIGELRNLTLPYGKNTLSLNFVALEYSDPTQNSFEYKMENYDRDWVTAGTNGFARYANLPPGRYTFKVKAANSDGVWNEQGKELQIYIQTPWWRTWWFYALCIATISAIAYGIFTYRLQQALKIERIRVRISSDLHDDVGTILSGLAMQSEILELTAPEPSKPKLQRISELSRSAMSRMRDTVWAIDARKDKLENLIDRMREHAEETLTPKDILLDLQVDQLAMHKNIPSQIRQALYLIYKEAITNIAKHSTADKVSVKLQKLGNHGLEMTIHDNGQVKIKDYKTTGSGLANMRMRAEQIGAAFQVDTTHGFLISIQLPRLS